MLSLSGSRDANLLILTRYLSRPVPATGAAWTGFVVRDIDDALASATKHGGTIEVLVHENADYATKAAIAADPDGHLIEIMQLLEPP